MAEQLATVEFAPIFTRFRRDIERLRNEVLVEGGKILKRETQASIRDRFYRIGATLNSLEEQTVEDGDSKTYQLSPTAVSKRGAPYPLFGEYGTGRRGAATGRPAPAGYRYGDQPGMTARRYGRIAVGLTQPQLERFAKGRLQQFALNQTI